MSVPDFKEIAIAWARKINPTESQMEKAAQRLDTCDTCEEKGLRGIPVPHYYCMACGCVLAAKVYTPRGKEACPKGKWIV